MNATPAHAATPARPRRSWLFTPATRPDRFDKAAASGADALIVDLEDAVSPDRKDDARRTALEWLAGPQNGAAPPVVRAVRINALNGLHGTTDLLALARSDARPDAVILPKTESADAVRLADAVLSEAGLACTLIPLIESARGVTNAGEIAAACPRVEALFVGAADLAADLGAEVAWEPLLTARSLTILAAAQARIGVIDSPFFDLNDDDGLAAEARRAVALGFTAKAAIHPKQIGPINDALTPTPQDVARARAVLAENAGGVGVVDGRMVDEAVARRARRILAAAGETIV